MYSRSHGSCILTEPLSQPPEKGDRFYLRVFDRAFERYANELKPPKDLPVLSSKHRLPAASIAAELVKAIHIQCPSGNHGTHDDELRKQLLKIRKVYGLDRIETPADGRPLSMVGYLKVLVNLLEARDASVGMPGSG